MKKTLVKTITCGAALSFVSLTHGALPTGYEFDITTSYSFSSPADLAPGAPTPSPDTGFLTILNAGSTTFNGQLSLSGVTPGLSSFTFSVPGVTLAPGQHLSLSLNNESSNVGGYGSNGPGLPQEGAEFTINGTVTDGTDTENVLLQVRDKDIHSGSPRDVHAAPSSEGGQPLFSDSYVLQGGDPLGGDTGDAFETTQANGHFVFFEAGPSNGVPDAGSTVALLGLAFSGLAMLKRRA